MAIQKAKQIKKKRKWFDVTAPAIFDNKELDSILAAEPETLVNRTIGADMSVLTGSMKDQNKKLVLKIIEVKGETANTTAISYYVTDGFMQRSLKKFPEQFFYVLTEKSKDGKQVKAKISVGGKIKMYRSQKSEILNIVKDVCEKEFSKQTSEGIFSPNYFKELELKLKKSTRTVYPVEHIKLWKVSIA